MRENESKRYEKENVFIGEKKGLERDKESTLGLGLVIHQMSFYLISFRKILSLNSSNDGLS